MLMRIFVAGASGVIGMRLLPMLIAGGHVVAAMTRSPGKIERLAVVGAEPIVCDVFDSAALAAAVSAFAPEMVMHQLTDLPDKLTQLADYAVRNDRIRTEGTRNLIAAAKAAGARRLLAQSIAWKPSGRAEVVEQHERQVLEAGGLVARYGQLYGPGTFYEDHAPGHPRVHVDAAARATIGLLNARPGVVAIVEDEHGHTEPSRVLQ
jgi:UDP-glucose 4-epimerase